MTNGHEIQSDQKVSVHLMITVQSQVHRHLLITLYELINFSYYVNLYSTDNSEGFSCMLYF